jgi:hypothetical protein
VRSDTSPNIGFRVPSDTRRLLEAVAYADLVTKRADATPSDINLSDFVRGILEDVINDFAEQAGGTEALLENLRVGEIRELEDKLARIKGLQDLEQKLDAQPAKPRRGRQGHINR